MRASTRSAVVLVAALLGSAGTAGLGIWQLDRAAQKEALQSSLDERRRLPALPAAELASSAAELPGQLDRAVHLRGRWAASATVYLENRQMNGRPGFFVVTPLHIGRGDPQDAVLVQRGWVARDAVDRTRLPKLVTPDGEVEVDGRVARLPGRLYDFGGAASGPIRQNLDPAELARSSGLRLRPLSVVQLVGSGPAARAGDDGLLRAWPQPAADVHKHYGYAVQWFALSALIAGLYVWFQLIRPFGLERGRAGA